MIFEIVVAFLSAVASIAICCTTALAWLILKAVGELQYRLNNPVLPMSLQVAEREKQCKEMVDDRTNS